MKTVFLNAVKSANRISIYPTEKFTIPHIRACSELVTNNYVNWGEWLTEVTIHGDFWAMTDDDIITFINLLFKDEVVIN